MLDELEFPEEFEAIGTSNNCGFSTGILKPGGSVNLTRCPEKSVSLLVKPFQAANSETFKLLAKAIPYQVSPGWTIVMIGPPSFSDSAFLSIVVLTETGLGELLQADSRLMNAMKKTNDFFFSVNRIN